MCRNCRVAEETEILRIHHPHKNNDRSQRHTKISKNKAGCSFYKGEESIIANHHTILVIVFLRRTARYYNNVCPV
jgi:hypothetical protein